MNSDWLVGSMWASGYTTDEIIETIENSARYWQSGGSFTEKKQKKIRDRIRLECEGLNVRVPRVGKDGACIPKCGTGVKIRQQYELEMLFDMIQTHAFVEDPSGKRRFDTGRIIGDPRGIAQAAVVLLDTIRDLEVEEEVEDGEYYDEEYEARSVGGIGAGSTSLAAAVSQLSYEKNPALCSFSVRNDGTGNRIDGRVRSPAVLVFDFVDAAAPVIETINCLRQEGIRADFVIALVHSGTEEIHREIKKHGAEMEGIFHLDAFAMPYYEP